MTEPTVFKLADVDLTRVYMAKRYNEKTDEHDLVPCTIMSSVLQTNKYGADVIEIEWYDTREKGAVIVQVAEDGTVTFETALGYPNLHELNPKWIEHELAVAEREAKAANKRVMMLAVLSMEHYGK